MNEPERILAAFNAGGTFSTSLGVRLVELQGSTCQAVLPYTDFLRNRTGAVHGGVVSALLDVVMGMALRGMMDDSMHASTVEMKVQYLAQAVGDLQGYGRVLKQGRTLCFTTGEVFDGRGKPVAYATGTYLVQPLAEARERVERQES